MRVTTFIHASKPKNAHVLSIYMWTSHAKFFNWLLRRDPLECGNVCLYVFTCQSLLLCINKVEMARRSICVYHLRLGREPMAKADVGNLQSSNTHAKAFSGQATAISSSLIFPLAILCFLFRSLLFTSTSHRI